MEKKDGHHILHYGKEWDLRPESKRIRNTPSLIPLIGRTAIHDVIHLECGPVPVPELHMLPLICNEFDPTRNTLDSMDRLMMAIEKACKHPRCHRLDIELAQLAIAAIDIQRPFIKEGLADNRRLTRIGGNFD